MDKYLIKPTKSNHSSRFCPHLPISTLMNKQTKTLVALLSFFAFILGSKAALTAFENHQISKLSTSIQNKQICESAENIMECSHSNFLRVARLFSDPLSGQEFLARIVKAEIEKSPEKGRFLRDQYFIFTANLYIRSLKQKSMMSFIPFISQHNIDIQVAKAFLQGMSDYSNRREVDRTIASETILQEVSNFNGSLEELTKTVELFH
jgi:hypothetical protein